jgi:hypothetical protein
VVRSGGWIGWLGQWWSGRLLSVDYCGEDPERHVWCVMRVYVVDSYAEAVSDCMIRSPLGNYWGH